MKRKNIKAQQVEVQWDDDPGSGLNAQLILHSNKKTMTLDMDFVTVRVLHDALGRILASQRRGKGKGWGGKGKG